MMEVEQETFTLWCFQLLREWGTGKEAQNLRTWRDILSLILCSKRNETLDKYTPLMCNKIQY